MVFQKTIFREDFLFFTLIFSEIQQGLLRSMKTMVRLEIFL